MTTKRFKMAYYCETFSTIRQDTTKPPILFFHYKYNETVRLLHVEIYIWWWRE